MLAQLAKKADGSWGVMMRREIYQHKHLISEDIYRYYPGIRQVSDDSPLLPGVEVLPEAKAGTTSIYDYIRSNSNHRVTMNDVRNLIARLKPKRKPSRASEQSLHFSLIVIVCVCTALSENDAITEMVLDFDLQSPKNVSTVNENVAEKPALFHLQVGTCVQ
ncbi:hypothetical protein L914_17451 [Phytophthora nicotianae]|uniref:Uncharacterized protein n=2 Tax=Phytophthora nicotianae TaxID=4792 RepID=V9DU04_PHYNI|nr:hypothetical protein F443_22533 [Phytophthora nicotianae P1569]ETM35672.1 hypothetical protein L914_17451 [Phytophthora nicotianae]